MKEAVIVSAVRTAVGKAKRGSLVSAYPEDMAALTIEEILNRVPEVKKEEIDDVIVGCAMPEGPQGFNLGRVVSERAGLPDTVPGVTVNRFCSSGLQTIAMGAQQIMSGMGDVVLAGGVESMSKLPMDKSVIVPNPWMIKNKSGLFLSMGMTAENVVDKYNITREEMDVFSLASNKKAIAAIDAGLFKDGIVPVPVERTVMKDGKQVTETFDFDVDEGPRRDSTIEALAKLRAAFKVGGTVTAGNSSQVSDGAAFTLLMSREKAESVGAKPLAKFIGYAVGGVAPEVMGLGPIVAIPKVLKQTGLSLKDIGLIELNEAFASQSLAVIKELNLNPDIINVNGGAIALGHPLGCTGAKLTVQIINEMRRRDVKYGLITMCIGGGMGAAGIVELL